jgi:hypothetical protein
VWIQEKGRILNRRLVGRTGGADRCNGYFVCSWKLCPFFVLAELRGKNKVGYRVISKVSGEPALRIGFLISRKKPSISRKERPLSRIRISFENWIPDIEKGTLHFENGTTVIENKNQLRE